MTVNGRHEDRVGETVDAIRDMGGDAIAVVGDLTRPGDVQRLVDETVRQRGGIDLAVCNAGGPPAGDFFAFPDDQAWLDAINLNLMSTTRLSRAVVPHLEQRGGGSITNIVSISVKQPIPHLVLSNTARTAVIGMAKSLADTVAGRNIRVNNVCPGSILTGRIRSLAATRAAGTCRTEDEILSEDAAAIPMGRIGRPQEFANVVAFIASPAASYVTGTTLLVDGGSFKGLM